MASSASGSLPLGYGSDSDISAYRNRDFILPFEIAKQKILEKLNSEPITLEMLEQIIRILKGTIVTNRSNLLFLTKKPLNLALGELDQEMNLFHIIFYQMLKERDPNIKRQFHDKILEIFEILPMVDRTDFLASQGISGRSVMYLAAATINDDFNLLQEFLVKLPQNNRSYCLERQEKLQGFTPLHLVANKVAKDLLRQNLPMTPLKSATVITSCKKFLKLMIAPLSKREKQRVKSIQDIFGRTYLQVIEDTINSR